MKDDRWLTSLTNPPTVEKGEGYVLKLQPTYVSPGYVAELIQALREGFTVGAATDGEVQQLLDWAVQKESVLCRELAVQALGDILASSSIGEASACHAFEVLTEALLTETEPCVVKALKEVLGC